MRKLIYLIVSITMVLMLVGCSKLFLKECPVDEYDLDSYEYASMELLDNSVTNGGLTLSLFYNGTNEGIYGSWYELQVREKDCWIPVDVVIEGNYAFTDIGLPVLPGNSRTYSVDWKWLYGELDVGKYRIIKVVLDFRESGDFDKHYLSVEFEIFD